MLTSDVINGLITVAGGVFALAVAGSNPENMPPFLKPSWLRIGGMLLIVFGLLKACAAFLKAPA